MPLDPTTRTPVCSSVPPASPGSGSGVSAGRLGPLVYFLGAYLLHYPASHVVRGEHAGTDGGEHVVRGGMVGRARHVLQDAGWDLADPALLQEGQDLLPSQAQVVLAVGLVEELPDLVPRPAALDHGQPVAAGPRVLARDDLDPVARDQLGVEGHDPVVYPGPYRAVADLGVDVVGEVYRGRPAGEADHVALRRKDEDLVGDELAL